MKKIKNKKFFLYCAMAFFLFLILGFFAFYPKLTIFSIKNFETYSNKQLLEISFPSVKNGQEIIYNGKKYSNNSGIIVFTKPSISCDWESGSIDKAWKSCEAVFEVYDERKAKDILSSPNIELSFKNNKIRNIRMQYSTTYKTETQEIIKLESHVKKLKRKRTIKHSKKNQTNTIFVFKPKKIKQKKIVFYNFKDVKFTKINISEITPKGNLLNETTLTNNPLLENIANHSENSPINLENKSFNKTKGNTSLIVDNNPVFENSSKKLKMQGDSANQTSYENKTSIHNNTLMLEKGKKISLSANLSQENKEGKVGLVGKIISAFRREELPLKTDKPFAIKILFEIPKYSEESFNFSIIEDNFKARIDPNISSCGTLNSENSLYTLNQSIFSDDTCFTITANNITLDCRNHRIVFANSSAGKGIYILANSTTVRNCIIEEGESGAKASSNIFLLNANNITIYNNTLIKTANSGFAIYIDSSTENKIINNRINVTGSYSYGMYVASRSENLNISFNHIFVTGEQSIGIYQSDSSNSAIIKNNLINVTNLEDYAIFPDSVNRVSITQNFLGISEEAYGIYSESCSGITIFKNNISALFTNSFGIYNVQSSLYNISKNTIIANGEEALGILLETTSNNNSVLFNSINISNSTSEAVEIYYSKYNNISSNKIFSDGPDSREVLLNLAENNSVEKNNLTNYGNSGSGIYLLTSKDNFLNENSIDIRGQSGYGVFIGTNTDNIFNKLNVQANATDSKAVYIHTGENNLTLNNSILNSSYSDIYLGGSVSGGNWELINVTYHKKNWSQGAIGNLSVYWYLRIIVYNNSGRIFRANVTIANGKGVSFYRTTNENGEISLLLKEYYQNSSDYIENYSNYTLLAFFGGLNSSKKINLTSNLEVGINISKIVSGDDSQGGNGGGGGSNGGGGIIPPAQCKPKWKCKKWSKCINGVKTRTCIDKNNCNTILNKPITKKLCKTSKNKKRKILFDINLNILDKEITNGVLSAAINLINVGLPGKVDAFLQYQIKENSGMVIYSEKQKVPVETQQGFIKNIDVSFLGKGNYSLWVNLTYEGQTEPAFAHEEFSIKQRSILLKHSKEIIIILIIAIAGLVVFLRTFLMKKLKSLKIYGFIGKKSDLKNKSVIFRRGTHKE